MKGFPHFCIFDHAIFCFTIFGTEDSLGLIKALINAQPSLLTPSQWVCSEGLSAADSDVCVVMGSQRMVDGQQLHACGQNEALKECLELINVYSL